MFDVSRHTAWATTVETDWAMKDPRSLQDLKTQVGNSCALTLQLYRLTRTLPTVKKR